MNTKQAKDFLVEQAAEQAAVDSVPLTDVEKRMMYFTESDAASCDSPIELNDEFEAQHETREYETKISRLLHRAHNRLKSEDPERVRNWDQAIRTLSKGDHYLLVMIEKASEPDIAWWLPILWGVGIGCLIGILLILEVILDQRGLIPGWVFGWISSDRATRRFEFLSIFYGCFGVWIIVKLAKLGVLGEMAKSTLNVILSTFSFLRTKSRSR